MHTYAYVVLMHAYAGTDLCMQLRFQRAMKDKFSALKMRFIMNSTSFGSRSKLPFFNYIKPYVEYFKTKQKNPKEKHKIH